MPTRPIAALLVAACLAALPAHARAQAVSGDLAKIQGKWWTRMYPLGGGRGIVQFIEIRGDAITGTNEDPGSKSVGRVKLDESKSPKAIDYLDTVADTKALKDIKLPDMHGIYETDGETLKIAMNTGILNSKRPTKFTFDYKNGISVTTYRRGEPTPEEAMPKVAAKARVPARVERTESFPGVTVEGIVDRKVHFRTADGRPVVTGVIVGHAVDAAGRRVARGLDLIVAGNVLDVTVVHSDNPLHPDQIKEARLVRGKTEHIVLENVAPVGRMNGEPAKPKGRVTYLPDMEGPGAVYHGAVIAKVEPMKVTLDVDGRLVEIGRTNANTVAINLEGQQMPVGQQARLLKVGNKVDVDVRPRRKPDNPNEMPIIRSIRLLEGQLADPVQYLNSPPVRR